MRNFSKSKLLSFRQCAKRLWLEIHHPELCENTAGTEASFAVGNQVGDIARQLYDPEGKGSFLDLDNISFAELLKQSETLCKTSKHPIFEAGFAAGGALALADVMLPTHQGRKRAWRMVEVKSSTSIKDYHRDDAAIQAFVARRAGVPLAGIALAHIDKNWVYPGKNDYQGLLVENDLTEEAFARGPEVETWIAEAQIIARKRKEPAISTGPQCSTPFACDFLPYCADQEPQAEYPINWLPRIQAKGLKSLIDEGVSDLRDVPDELLNERQLRVKNCTLTGESYFDAAGAAADLAAHKLPGYFLDFETIQFAIPIWKGTRPYQQIPFQFSLHRLSRTGKLEHKAFLDLSGKDPSKAFAEALIATCGERGPVFVYNAAFEKTRIKELANRFKRLKKPLLAINDRIVDLLRIAESHYYHPSQQGSWSIKKVLPAIAPDMRYDALDGVQDGGMAMEAFKEAICPKTSVDRKAEIEKQLLEYCGLDTLAMVKIWELFSKTYT
jgi:hypothetical protein